MPSVLGHFLQGALCHRGEQSRDGWDLSPTWLAGPRVISGQALVMGGGSGLPSRDLGQERKTCRSNRVPGRHPRPRGARSAHPGRSRQMDCRPQDGLPLSVLSQCSPRQPQSHGQAWGLEPLGQGAACREASAEGLPSGRTGRAPPSRGRMAGSRGRWRLQL